MTGRAAASLHHAESLVLRRHREEVLEPLLEDFPPRPGGRDPADANPFVGGGKALEVLPGRWVPLEPPPDVPWESPLHPWLRVLAVIEGVLEALEAESGHAAGGDQAAPALAVHGREPTGGPPGTEALGPAVLVHRLRGGIDPTVAQRLLDGVVIGNAWLAAMLLVIDEPNVGRCPVVLGKPGAPRLAVLGVEGLPELHPAGLSPSFFVLSLRSHHTTNSTAPTSSAIFTNHHTNGIRKTENSFQAATPTMPTAASWRIGLNMARPRAEGSRPYGAAVGRVSPGAVVNLSAPRTRRSPRSRRPPRSWPPQRPHAPPGRPTRRAPPRRRSPMSCTRAASRPRRIPRIQRSRSRSRAPARRSPRPPGRRRGRPIPLDAIRRSAAPARSRATIRRARQGKRARRLRRSSRRRPTGSP